MIESEGNHLNAYIYNDIVNLILNIFKGIEFWYWILTKT